MSLIQILNSLEKSWERDEILLKKSNAGAKATGKKFSFPENIKKKPKIIIKVIIKYFLYRVDN